VFSLTLTTTDDPICHWQAH